MKKYDLLIEFLIEIEKYAKNEQYAPVLEHILALLITDLKKENTQLHFLNTSRCKHWFRQNFCVYSNGDFFIKLKSSDPSKFAIEDSESKSQLL